MAEYVKATLAELQAISDANPAAIPVGAKGWVTTGDKIYEWDGDSWVLKSIAGAALVTDQSLIALTGGQSAAVTISTTSAQSAAITTGWAIVTPSVDCFFRQGTNPTALSNGTDQILLAGNSYRINGIVSGDKLAFITASGGGTVYI